MRTLHFTAGPRHPSRALQRGLTLIEFMVSIAIGMIIVAALATLIADQSNNRAEVDRSGRLIESGRYAARTLTEDLQMAGYWGELTTPPSPPAAWKDPCGANPAAPTQAEMVEAMGLHITGFEVPGAATRPGYNDTVPALPAPVTLACLPNLKPGTDVVVVRWAQADSSAYESGTPPLPDIAKLTNADNSNRLFIQTGLDPGTGLFNWKADIGANAAASFTLIRKDPAQRATVRKVVTRLYYVATCSVCTGTPDTIPSLKMKELVQGGATPGQLAWSDPVTISEGIENLQIEYGVDAAATKDGTPDADMVASAVALGDWPGVVSAKLYLLARSVDPAPGYDECSDPANIPASCKQYPLGAAGTVLPAGAERRYKRHVFVQSVRLVNPSFRRAM
jgi:type IV pilus assembly protein PilW